MFSDYTPKDVDRFWSKVAKTDNPDECWNWMAGTRDGYGDIRIQHKTVASHRIAYQLTHGDIPDDLHVLHHCDNRRCCNPRHLYLGTNLDNVHDRVMRGRNGDVRGEKHGRHKLTWEQVKIIRERYARGGVSYKQLAREFEMSPAQIRRVANGNQWRA